MPKKKKTISEIFAAYGKQRISLSADCSINAKGELLLYGIIGDFWDDMDALSVIRQLESLNGDEIVIRIHSDGGNVVDGLAMCNAIKNSSKRFVAYIDGIAASMAVPIACACDQVYIPSNALMMMHTPRGPVYGNGDELRDAAQLMDTLLDSYSQIVADKSGKPLEEIRALLVDGKDHLYRGQEAIDFGLADELTDAVQAAAHASFKHLNIPDDYAKKLFTNHAAAAAQHKPEPTMIFKIKAKSGGTKWATLIVAALAAQYQTVDDAVTALSDKGLAVDAKALSGEAELTDEKIELLAAALKIKEEPQNPAPAQNPTGVAADAQAAASEAVKQERKRMADLRNVAAQAGIEDKVLNKWIDDGISVETARASALEVVAQRTSQGMPQNPYVRTHGADMSLKDAIAQACLVRAVPSKYKHTEASKDFNALSMMELARAYLESCGERVRGKSVNDVIAMAYHSSSDFPGILADVANKEMIRRYMEAPRTFQRISRRTTATDFKAKNVLALGSGSGLSKVLENGEFKRGTITEAKDSYRLDTYGIVYGFSRQMMINDDLGAFTEFSQNVGSNAARMESDVFWTLVKSAAQYNGSNLYATGSNTQVTGTATIVLGMDTMKAALRKQKGLDSEHLNLTPAVLVVNTDREVEAEKLLMTIQPTAVGDVNVYSNKMDLVVESRLDGVSNNPFYIFADPSIAPVFDHCYLNGEEQPYIETRQGFDVDGLEIKVRHDFAAGVSGGRGVVKNPGA